MSREVPILLNLRLSLPLFTPSMSLRKPLHSVSCCTMDRDTFDRHAKSRADMQGSKMQQKSWRCKRAADVQGWRPEIQKVPALSQIEMNLKTVKL